MGTGLRIAALVVALLAGLIAFLPMRAALAMAGVDTGGAVYGPVWNARLYNTRIDTWSVDSVEAGLSPAALLTGRVSLDWQAIDPGIQGGGRYVQTLSGRSELSGTRLILSPGFLAPGLSGILAPDDIVVIQIDQARWQDGQCLSADGSVRSDALYTLGQRLDADLPPLDGTLSCEDGVLTAALAGAASDGEVRIAVTLDGRVYGWRAGVRTGDPNVEGVLRTAGFNAEDGGWMLSGNGIVQP
ncbi:type II secretion system protein N [Hyphobacterium marinum]|uniref:Type II secretion system protein N n=1 Tax=Hyphobacterium marinum TaxID=3116574 RepID=A0ABU7LW35_9PROT|nr:type II secretion system protein N [Hyphobacterium sp. Y6023]MEE2565768.1 type II secretion system protein N [Hyphobacterium sp. Y6023]